MIPALDDQEILEAHDSTAELEVYRALRDSLSEEYTVFYSVRWLAKGRSGQYRDGETDFVVIHPELGLLVVEVKGGGLERDAGSGRWFTWHGSKRTDIQNPFAQAENSKHALIEKIRSMPAWEDRRLAIGHSVFLPDIREPQAYLGADVPKEIVGFADDVDRIDQWVAQVYEYWNSGGVERYRSELSTADVQALRDALVPDIEISPSLGAALLSDSREIRRLTVEQYSLLSSLSMQPRVAVRGGAGTGKTMLAIEKARRLASEGNRTLLTCFNRSLGHMFQRLEKPDGLTATNFQDLAWALAELAGCDVPSRTQDQSRWGGLPQQFWDVKLPESMIEAVDRMPELRFDAIVVDEGQDFHEGWWTALQLAQSDKEKPVLYVFYDDNQRLYRDTTALPSGMVEIPLTINMRNSKAIHAIASRQYVGSEFTCGGPAGRDPAMVAVADVRSMQRELSRMLHRLVKEEGVRPAEIAVLTGRSLARSSACTDGRIGAFETAPADVEQGEKVTFDTIRRFKGLERPVIMLCELDEADRELIYVGLTRARSHVVIVGSDEFLGSLV